MKNLVIVEYLHLLFKTKIYQILEIYQDILKEIIYYYIEILILIIYIKEKIGKQKNYLINIYIALLELILFLLEV